MNSRTKKLVSLLCVAAILVSALPMSVFAADEGEHDHGTEEYIYVNGEYILNPDVAPKFETSTTETAALFAAPRAVSGFRKAEGYQEGAYATWPIGAGVTKYEAYVAPAGGNYVKLDDKLVREYPGYMRADALGLKAGTYTIKVVDNLGNAMVTDPLTVVAHERTGFGFVNGTSSGAYNADGTLKSNAVVVYVDNSNFNSVQATIGSASYTGVQSIVSESGASKGAPGTPVCIRVLGTIDTTGFPKGSWGSSAEGLQVKAGSAKAKNLTIEGVGNDATFNGFGMLIRNCENVEVRNLALMNFADDGVSIDTDNKYLWIHNNDFFYGGPGSDSDQAKGDGSLDAKASYYCTFSYNHFWDSGKCSLLGMKNPQDYFTYHHNWFDHSDSRHPRIRLAKSVHIYNNYYDGNSKYGVGAALNSGAFVEANYFRNCKYPMLSSMQGSDIAGGGKGTFSSEDGGVIKAYNNKIIGAQGFIPYDAQNAPVEFDAYVAKTRGEKVPGTVAAKQGGTTYTNFDTTDNIGVTAAQVQSPDEAMLTTTKWAGRVDGGDFQWIFNNAVDDESYAVNAGLKNALTTYKTSLVSVDGTVTKPVSGGDTPSHTHTPGAWQVTKVPGCDPDTQALVEGEETQYCTICGEVMGTRMLPGAHSNDGNGECTVCHKKVDNGGGPTVGANSKILNAVDFIMHEATGSGSNIAAMRAEDMAAVADEYFTMSGSGVNKRTKNATTVGSKAEWIDLPKSGDGGIQFTVGNAPADVTIFWGNTGKGADKASSILVKDSAGTEIKTETLTTNDKSGTTSTTLKLEGGTYTVASVAGAKNPVRLYTLTVTEAQKKCNWGDWEVVTPATCGKDGLMKRECQDPDCDEVEYDTIDATGNHTWGDWVASGDNEETHTCLVCGETETRSSGEEPTPPVVDKSGLTAIIAQANAALDGVAESDNAAKVPVGTSWAEKTDLDAFKAAIAKAQAVADKTDAAAADVSKAVTDLNAAITAFVGKLQDGTKPNGGTTETKKYTLLIDEVVETLKTNPPAGWTTANIDIGSAPLANQGTEGIFTLYPKKKGTSGSKFVSSEKNFSDGILNNQFNPGGAVGVETDGAVNGIGFTTTAAATVKVWWIGGKNSETRHMTILNSEGREVAVSEEGYNSTQFGISEMKLSAAGTYYLGGKENSNSVYKVEVTVTTTSGGDDPTPPAPVDKSALNDAITAAEEKLASVDVESVDGTDVETTKKWATKESKELFAAEIAMAKLSARLAKTEDDVTAAINALKAASDAFVVKPGTKTDTPDNPGGNGGGGGGGGGGSSSSSTKKPTGQIADTVITMDSSTTAGHVATVELSDSQAKTLTNNAVKSGSGEIVVSVNAPKSAAGVSMNVSASALKNMSGKTDAALALQAPMGSMRLPHAAVAGLGSSDGKDISFTIARTNDGMKVTVTADDKTLDAVFGGVTVVANADGNGTVAYLRTADGEKLLKKSYVDGGKLYANLPGSGEIILKDNAKTFRDVENNWAKSAIDFAASRELFNGVNELDFAPNQEMTRSMLVTVLYRLEGSKGNAVNSFTDVPADSWYTEAVAWANAEGIVSGKSATHFGPNDDITREQLATILYRYATKLCGMSEVSEDSKALEKFSDKTVVSGFAEDGMAWAVEQGIISGRGDGTLAPGGFASRAEVATMLMRFVKAIV